MKLKAKLMSPPYNGWSMSPTPFKDVVVCQGVSSTIDGAKREVEFFHHNTQTWQTYFVKPIGKAMEEEDGSMTQECELLPVRAKYFH